MTRHDIRRKPSTIFSANAVGFSRLMGADEEGTLRPLPVPGTRSFVIEAKQLDALPGTAYHTG